MRYVIATAFLCFFTLAAVAAPTARQQEVAQKGAMVMPFNVHNSTHVFQKNQYGGIQQVVAKDPNDKDLVAAIRTHLEMEAERFGKRDYSDPMKIHGKGMPGVQYLSKVKPGQIAITYREVPAGAAVDYVGRDAATADAIHKWFDAQLSDHGEDATSTPPK
ncbi:MAG: aspartate carbamoyltransferase [Bacillota bacterium]